MPPSDKRALLRGLIGKPYRAGAGGPDAFDCYGLARHVMRELYAVALPDRIAPAAIRRSAWRRVAFPADGAIVLMGAGPTPKHIGVYLGDGVLHALEGAGVVFDPFDMLPFRGFGHFRVYLPA
jgi:cell wall-associated NlpC family hydrolase